MKANEIVVGCRYFLRGDLQNGSYLTHEEVTRKVVRVTATHVVCECGRRFVINANLNVKPV